MIVTLAERKAIEAFLAAAAARAVTDADRLVIAWLRGLLDCAAIAKLRRRPRSRSGACPLTTPN